MITFKSLFTPSNKSKKKAAAPVARTAAMLLLGVALSGFGHHARAANKPSPAHARAAASVKGPAAKPQPQAAGQPASAAQPVALATTQTGTPGATSGTTSGTTQASTQPGAQPVPQAGNLPAPPGQFHDVFTLADAGAPQVEMRGIDSQHSIYFTLPQTHVARSAKVHIFYAFSPSLLPQLSQIKLMMNGTLFATVQPTPGAQGGSSSQDQDAEFSVPPDLLVHNNTFTMEFIGHYTMVCEDPANTTLWARVHRNTYLDIQGDLLPLADNLKQLPMPFLDPSVIGSLAIPVVFPSAPTTKAIQAAGIVTSYFGLIAESRPVRFPVHIGQIPAGNAIVVTDNPANLPPSLEINGVTSPTVAMRANPNDAFGKLLVVTGADAAQLMIAAQAVAMHTDMLAGPEATFDRLTLPTRQPADSAPRWARTDQTIALWDYATTEQLQGDGSGPLNVYFRVPPDIYYAAEQPNAILRLAYRYNSIPIGPISSMQVRVNNAFLGSVPLVPAQEVSHKLQVDVPVPVVNLRPFSNSLSFDFTFQLLKKGGCQDTTPINMQGSVLKDTYLDLRGYPHYAPLPNLEVFANAGFPFTRFADLGQTTVVLPQTPTEQEIETYVTLTGHFGRQTGFPALRVTVAGPEALRSGADGDFLVIGTGDDQPGFDTLAKNLPVALRSGQIQIHDTQGFFAPQLHRAWWKLKSDEHTESGDLTASGIPDAVIEGIRSPFNSGNDSVVAIHLRDQNSFEPFMATFLKVQQSSDISGSVAVLHGTQFQSFRIGAEVYHVGVLPWWVQLRLWFMEFPWLAAVIVFGMAFLVAVWGRQWLRRRARARLKVSET